MKRPDLQMTVSSKEFETYYYLKSELTEFCKKHDLQTSGSKEAINNRISHFLSTGEKLVTKAKVKSKKSSSHDVLSLDSIIEKDFVCSQNHRYFFKEVIGKHFTFNTEIQNWFKENDGKTYNDAIEAYKEIIEYKKKNETTITKQFEYNTYIREFFADNKGKPLNDAIKCWKQKKNLPGHNKYEAEDLAVL